MEEALHPLIPYAIAAGLGALIGLERQYSAAREDQQDSAGVRTHAFWGLVGVLAAQLSRREGWEVVYVVGLMATGIFLGISNILKFYTTGDRGFTTELSQLVAFLIAALVEDGQYMLAVPLTVGATVILRAKESLHNLSEQFGPKEMNATIRFAVIVGAVLPFLPDQGMGPFQAFNPQKIWLMVVLVSSISFFGYMLVLFLGDRGVEITGFLSGFVSSTAATMQLSRQSREAAPQSPYVRALLMACTISFPRVLLLVWLVGSTELFRRTAGPLLLVAAVGAVAVLIVWWRDRTPEPLLKKIGLGNPLRLTWVLSFGAVYAVIGLLTAWVLSLWSDQGVLLLSAASGISGMSAITLSLCHLENADLAARGILLASAVATLVKCCLVLILGSSRFRLWTFLGLLAMAGTAGAAGLLGWGETPSGAAPGEESAAAGRPQKLDDRHRNEETDAPESARPAPAASQSLPSSRSGRGGGRPGGSPVIRRAQGRLAARGFPERVPEGARLEPGGVVPLG